MMDYKPLNLPVFQRREGSTTTRPLPVNLAPLYVFNGTDFTSSTAEQVPLEGLGYEGNALAVQPESDIAFALPHLRGDSILVELGLLPNHPVNGEQLRFVYALDGTTPLIINSPTPERTLEWKKQ